MNAFMVTTVMNLPVYVSTSGYYVIFMVEYNGDIIAWMIGTLTYINENDHAYVINDYCVLPKHENRGIITEMCRCIRDKMQFIILSNISDVDKEKSFWENIKKTLYTYSYDMHNQTISIYHKPTSLDIICASPLSKAINNGFRSLTVPDMISYPPSGDLHGRI